MGTVQLRRYQIKSGEMEDFVKNWTVVPPLRRRYGFEVLFAFVDESTNEFVWAISHEGDREDFNAAEKHFLESEAAAMTASQSQRERIDEYFVSMVDVLYQGWPSH